MQVRILSPQPIPPDALPDPVSGVSTGGYKKTIPRLSSPTHVARCRFRGLLFSGGHVERNRVVATVFVRDEYNRGEKIQVARVFQSEDSFERERELVVYNLFKELARQIIKEEKWKGLEFLGFKVE
jgi:hypothetical protein